jgi:hypothetical protein
LNELRERLVRLLDLVRREDEHLQAVRQRLLGDDCGVPAERAQQLLATDLGIDRPDDLASALERACQFTHRMHADFEAMHAYALEHLLNP